jgi:hypothetical protein
MLLFFYEMKIFTKIKRLLKSVRGKCYVTFTGKVCIITDNWRNVCWAALENITPSQNSNFFYIKTYMFVL